MPVFLVSYTSRDRSSEDLDGRVRGHARDACRIDASLWLVDADAASEDILKALKKESAEGDRVFVVRINRDYASNLPESGLRWLLAPERRWADRPGLSSSVGFG